MRINIGSINPKKVEAAQETINEYEQLRQGETSLCALPADSEVSNQPKTLEEMITGARNRARNAFLDCEISIGIESGIMPAQGTRTGYIGVCVCAIYTGKENDFYIGQSTGFEYPTEVIKRVIEKGMEIDDAFKDAGFTDNPRIGYSTGVIGYLTNNKITRKSLAKEAIRMALASFLNKEFYKNDTIHKIDI
ncbi:inosine/xanthosine triphosphatase [Candidatus Woesearchaeota archaeon]|nr:inosine/xanthosine triphosphatase [Candidatus Woesearchaeota archaeon]